MSEWKKVKLGDCIKEIKEKTIKNNQYEVLSVTKDGIFSQEEFFKKQVASENNIGYKIIRRNNLVFSTMNLWMGSLDVLTNYDIGIVSPAYKVFEFNENLMIPEYGNYFMKSYYMLEQYKNCSEQGASVVRRNLDLKALLKIEINIPTIEEQESIVKLLTKVDYIINKYEKLLKEKDKFIKSQFVEMFENEEYSKDELKNLSKEIYAGGDKPKDISQTQNEEYLYPVFANGYENQGLQGYSKKYKTEDEALTISARGTIGYSFIRKGKFTPIVRLITIIPNEKVNVIYLKYAIDNLNIAGSGTSQAQLTVPNIKKHKIVLPPIELQNQFADIIKRVDKEKLLLEQQKQNYKQLKKALMQKLLTGKVKLKI